MQSDFTVRSVLRLNTMRSSFSNDRSGRVPPLAIPITITNASRHWEVCDGFRADERRACLPRRGAHVPEGNSAAAEGTQTRVPERVADQSARPTVGALA